MSVRLYDSAWVVVEGIERPLVVRRDVKNATVFHVGEFQYDVDGRPLRSSAGAPEILKLHSLQSAQEAGLSISYERKIDLGT